jgi:hypothetical protein
MTATHLLKNRQFLQKPQIQALTSKKSLGTSGENAARIFEKALLGRHRQQHQDFNKRASSRLCLDSTSGQRVFILESSSSSCYEGVGQGSLLNDLVFGQRRLVGVGGMAC